MSHGNRTGRNVLLLLARVVAAGSLLLAGATKLGLLAGAGQLTRAPLTFALSIQSFRLLPDGAVPLVAYYLPWLELTLAVPLLLGLWSRQSAALATALLTGFTLALASVLWRGLDVDCGCFGGLFGESTVSTLSLLRNSLFIVAGACVALWGGGALALRPEHPPTDRGTPDTGAAPTPATGSA